MLDAYANGVHVFRFINGSARSLKGIQAGESKFFTLSSANTAARNASLTCGEIRQDQLLQSLVMIQAGISIVSEIQITR